MSRSSHTGFRWRGRLKIPGGFSPSDSPGACWRCSPHTLLLPSAQAWFFVYGLVIAAGFVIAWKAKASCRPALATRNTPLTAALVLRWILLAALPFGLMQSLAGVLGAGAEVVVALYFVTLALAFSGLPDVFIRATRLLAPLPLIAVGVSLAAVFAQAAPNWATISLTESAFFLVAFAVAALGCHCELARQKPDASSFEFFCPRGRARRRARRVCS